MIVRCFGITKDPETNNFMMVMELKEGSLRQHLIENFITMSWRQKLRNLQCIASGLKSIHNNGLIHRDFHCGNILSNLCNLDGKSYITDLGLCQPANVETSQDGHKKIYGVLPYVAPEVLKGKDYTSASDIYGFGIIAYEICTGLPPYHDVSHDEFLAIRICQGLRPHSNYKIPQLIFDIIIQCWDADPLKRPKADKLHDIMWDLYSHSVKNSEISKQIILVDKINEKFSFSTVQSPSSSTNTLSYTTHPQAVYTSRLLDYKKLQKPKNDDDDDDDDKSFGMEYSGNLYKFKLYW
jgi:serine/threonine protein kinase